MFGLAFGLLRETVIIGAIHQQTKSIYYSRGQNYERQFEMRLRFDQGEQSDSISMLRVYLAWKRNGRNEGWCYSKGLDKKVLKEVECMERELIKRFKALNIPSSYINSPCFEDNDALSPKEKKEKLELLKYVLAMGFFKNFMRCEYRYLENIIKRKFPQNAVSFNQLPQYYEEEDVLHFFNQYGQVQKLDLIGKPSVAFQAESNELHDLMKKALRIGTTRFGHKSMQTDPKPYEQEAGFNFQEKQDMLRRVDLHRPNNSFELKLHSLFNFQIDCGPSSDSLNYTTLQFDTRRVVDSWFVAQLVTDPTDTTTRCISKSVTRMPDHHPMLYVLVSLLVARKVDILSDKSFTKFRGVRIDNTAKFLHFPFVLDDRDIAQINKFRSLLFDLFFNIDFRDYSSHSQSLVSLFYSVIERERESRTPVRRDYIRDDSVTILNEDVISRWDSFAKFSTTQIDQGAPDFLASLHPVNGISDLEDGFSFGRDEQEDEQTLLMKKKLQMVVKYEEVARRIQRQEGGLYCKECGNAKNTIAAVASLERVKEHQDYVFFLLYMMSSEIRDSLKPEDEGTQLAKAFSIVPDVTSYIYCMSGLHLLAVYTKQNRYVLHLGSPVAYVFPLIEVYELPYQAKTWSTRLNELKKVNENQKKARLNLYNQVRREQEVGGCLVCKGVKFKDINSFVRHMLQARHQKAREEQESELQMIQ